MKHMLKLIAALRPMKHTLKLVAGTLKLVAAITSFYRVTQR